MSNFPNRRVQILVADDYEPWRVRVREILQFRPEWQIVCEVGDGGQAVNKMEEFVPDVVLLDIGMPVLNGIEAAQQILKKSVDCKVLFLTENNDEEVRAAALRTGAEGYVHKSEAARELIPAIAAALR